MKNNITIASVFGLLVGQSVNATLGKRTADAAEMNFDDFETSSTKRQRKD